MKYTKSIKTISDLKAHASEMVNDASINGTPYIITQKGEAKAILLDLKEYERQQDKIALLQIIAHSEDQIRKGKFKPLKEAFIEIDKKIEKLKKNAIRSNIK
jgi:prevent-host-death family protein